MPLSPGPLRVLLALVVVLPGLLLTGPVQSADAATASCSAATPIASRPVLRKGDKGSCVRLLQDLLAARGYHAKTNGSFDATTDVAVRRFQHDHLTLAIDGVVTAATWGALVGGGELYSIQRGPHRSDAVVLSFDDCPKDVEAFRAAVLGAEDLGIALTLQPTGQCLQAGRFDANFARKHGHYVFNHSVTHARLTELSASKVYAELGAPGVVTTYGRPPFGAYNTETVRNAYAQRGLRIWTWTLDTRDWEGKSADEVVALVVANAQKGDVVLMHMQWNAFNPDALGAMVHGLESLGRTVCQNHGQTSDRPTELDCLP